MSKKAKKPKKAPAEEKHADAPAPVPHFDAKRLWKNTVKYASVTFTKDDGTENSVLVPYTGRSDKKRDTEAALQYMRAQTRVREAWRAEELTPEELEPLRESLITTAADLIALQLATIVEERFGEEGLISMYGPDFKSLLEGDRFEASFRANYERGSERQAQALRYIYADDPEELDKAIRQIEYDAVTAVLLDFEDNPPAPIADMSAEEFDVAFKAAMDESFDDRRQQYAMFTAEYFAQNILTLIEAGTRPLEELLPHLGITPTGDTELDLPTPEIDRAGLGILSMQPAQTIDRAARGPSGWQLLPNRLPRFVDPRSPLFVEYQRDGATAEALAEGVSRLNPRTADVWRLMTARSLEAWQPGQDAPPAVWFDVREIAAAMGYKKHHKGGYKPEHLAEVVSAVHALDSFHLTLPLGTKIHEPAKAGSKRRPPIELTGVRMHKVLHISERDEIRNLFGERYELRYKLKPGEWIRLYPRTYAPLFKALVELPAKAGANTWAKSIGTEILFQYRQNAKSSAGIEKLKVRTILERAVLLEEALQNPKKGRVRTYFEEALGILEAESVCTGWEYAPEDSDRLEAIAGTRGWFDVWLECRVLITTPDRITSELQATSDTAKKAQRKRSLGSTK